MTLEESIQGFRLRVLADAARSGNVSATCRRYEVSRTLFYRWRGRLEQYGRDGFDSQAARPAARPPAAASVCRTSGG